jgi:diadenosine tetraphosphate (Ap4A) HIT family hydrolase
MAAVGRHTSLDSDVDAWKLDRVGAARRGENPTVLARMRSGWAVIGDSQHLPGYCVLLADVDDVDHLTELPRAARLEFLDDMALLGEAVFNACNGIDPHFRRINYEVLGNTLHTLHAHVHARYSWEPAEYRGGPVWRYPAEVRAAPEHELAPEHDDLRAAITRELERLIAD